MDNGIPLNIATHRFKRIILTKSGINIKQVGIAIKGNCGKVFVCKREFRKRNELEVSFEIRINEGELYQKRDHENASSYLFVRFDVSFYTKCPQRWKTIMNEIARLETSVKLLIIRGNVTDIFCLHWRLII